MANPLDSDATADERILDAGYALFFEALLNEPFLDLELFRATSTEPGGRHAAEDAAT